MSPQTIKSLHDASNACSEAGSYIWGISLEEYRADRATRLIVERLLIIVGEALNRARRSDPDIGQLLPEISNVIAMRNLIVHNYDTINHRTVWIAVVDHVPMMKKNIDLILSDW